MLNLPINIIKQPGTKIVPPLVHKNICIKELEVENKAKTAGLKRLALGWWSQWDIQNNLWSKFNFWTINVCCYNQYDQICSPHKSIVINSGGPSLSSWLTWIMEPRKESVVCLLYPLSRQWGSAKRVQIRIVQNTKIQARKGLQNTEQQSGKGFVDPCTRIFPYGKFACDSVEAAQERPGCLFIASNLLWTQGIRSCTDFTRCKCLRWTFTCGEDVGCRAEQCSELVMHWWRRTKGASANKIFRSHLENISGVPC